MSNGDQDIQGQVLLSRKKLLDLAWRFETPTHKRGFSYCNYPGEKYMVAYISTASWVQLIYTVEARLSDIRLSDHPFYPTLV